ncbi:hypothetical protein CPB83DRAFT_785597 [Crepidotus variabilis]|uniref:F-box domain-containing protein n=1 Tax=Crepidotus variabilis TaxID=179855 RepID=A0A9P6JTG0_9AGAR|nr:hypothetical protein CPB83DRAFT_785597 [Crepidotus variabilis]
MAHSRSIDNDDALFQFDPFDPRQSFVVLSSTQPFNFEAVGYGADTMSSHGGPPTSEELVMDLKLENNPTHGSVAKGKAKTMPMVIRSSPILHDNFEFAPANLPSPSSFGVYGSSLMAFSPSTSNLSSEFENTFRHRGIPTESMEELGSSVIEPSFSTSYPGKGKQREDFPLLPPLNFSAMDLDYNPDLPPTPGPSSYGTLASPATTNRYLIPSNIITERNPSTHSPLSSRSPGASPAVLRPPVLRCRSLTNLSHQLPPTLGSAPTTITIQSSFGPSNSPSNISRQLLEILDKKDNDISHNSLSPTILEPATFISKSDLHAIQREPGSCPPAWYTVNKPVDLSILPPTPSRTLRHKGRSQSSPYPASALDFVPVTSTDIFQPLHVVTLNYFDLILPKELRLYILCYLVELHEDDYQRCIEEGRLTMAKAASSRNRWFGRDKGVRELFRLGRVSKSWQALIFDGQLWANLDLRSFQGLPQDFVARIVNSAGSFIHTLNLSGHTRLLPETLTNMANDLCLTTPDTPLAYTQLTNINLQGCTSLTTRSLHHLLVRSKFVTTLSVKGLSAATNTTCDIIGNFCRNLESLNMCRCPNIDAEGIKALAFAANLRREHLAIKELRLSGLKFVTDPMMRELGKAAPYLEILDLSYSRQLHNSAVEAFVACPGYMDEWHNFGVDTIEVTARDLGRETGDLTKMKRRVTRLKHLILSSCIMLTDTACSNLAYSVPKLEFLELGGIGVDLKEPGLIRLLRQIPHIRRLDLEDASDITDAVIRSITPAVDTTNATSPSAYVQPGSVLEHLVISQGNNVSEETLLNLVRHCPRLTVFEADNTRMSKTVLKEFIRLSRERKALNARVVAIDCRGIGETIVKEVSPMTRPRLGWRRYDARKLYYLDGKDENEDELKTGQDECDPERIVLKSFYSWQTVDAVRTIREKRRKAAGRRVGSDGSISASDLEGGTGGRRRSTRWWSPGGRRSRSGANSGSTSPILTDLHGSDGCTMM